ncbi:alpha/beta hydrolase [Streptacidiphilus rugosus]|uniref:alpha/beta hydrolase n=1 Tax=Streptacidiphilus rugosus TaxID=405783 RepID=UPI00068D4B5E
MTTSETPPEASDRLSPAARALCDLLASAFPDPAREPLTVASMRAAARAGVPTDGRPSGPVLAEVRDLGAGGSVPVPMRLYRPDTAAGRPLLVFLHGGGFVICDLDTHDRTARELAHRTGAAVLSVDYRLAPEHPFPAAAEDALAALSWAVAHAAELGCDPARVFVGGDSAGGNLAVGAALGLRDAGGPALAGQLLIYPSVQQDVAGGSAEEFAQGYFMTIDHIRWFSRQYLGPSGDPYDPRASPVLAADLAGLPPALLVVADCDTLRDQALAYARRLAAAGVPAEVQLHPGVFHGFLGVLGALPEAESALAGAASWLRRRAGQT